MTGNSELVSIGDLELNGAILKIQDGNHGEKHPKATDYVNDGIPFIMANNISGNTVDIKNAAKLPIVSHIAPYIMSHYNILCNKKWLKFPQG